MGSPAYRFRKAAADFQRFQVQLFRLVLTAFFYVENVSDLSALLLTNQYMSFLDHF